MPPARWLYLPIDVKVREIEAKACLAFYAAKRGYNVVIGQKQNFPSILSCYPPGFYIGFGALSNFGADYKRFRQQGHKIILMDEEGLVTHNENIYLQNRLDPTLLDLSELFVAWGDNQAEFIKRHRLSMENKICIAGNPRFDVLRPEFHKIYEDEIRHLKATYGDFILINSNFGSSNHFTGGPNYLRSLEQKKIICKAEDLAYFKRYFEYRERIMAGILNAIPALRAEFPDRAIIIRPHPSESHVAWSNRTAGMEKVFVIHKGSAMAWILASACLIHNFCTTALEAFALRKTTIAYRPFIDRNLETALPSLASIEAFTENELIEKVKNAINGQTDPHYAEKKETLGHHIANLGGPLAVETLLNCLDKITLPGKWNSAAGPYMHELRKIAEKIKKKIGRQPGNNYAAHKFENLGIEEIKNLARKMESQTGEFSGLRLKNIHKNCIMIKAS